MSDSNQYYVRFRGRILGPITDQKARDLIRRGQISRQHELSLDRSSWQRADEFPDLFPGGAAKVHSDGSSDSGTASKGNGAPTKSVDEWYIHINGQQQGPLTSAAVQDLVRSGTVSATTPMWRPGLADWQTADQLISHWLGVSDATSNGIADHRAGPQAIGLLSAAARALDSPDLPRASASEVPTDVVRELLRGWGWCHFSALFFIVFGSLWLIGTISLLIVGLSNRTEILPFAFAAVVLLASIYFSTQMVITGVLLLRMSSAVNSVGINPTMARLTVALQRRSNFWVYAGINLMAFLIFICIAATYSLMVSAKIGGRF